MRIDKFLWAVRLFKTRTLATERIRDGKVELAGDSIKPSREVKPDDEVVIRQGAVFSAYRIKALPKSRVGPKLVDDYIVDITPEEERQKALVIRESRKNNMFFQGRPTKKTRRDWNKLIG